jgi:hypothetical protein
MSIATLLAAFLVGSAPDASAIRDPLTKPGVFDRLTGSTWCDADAPTEGMFIEFKCWVFRTNGTYEWAVLTDYTPAPRGAGSFNIDESPNGFVLALDSGERHRLSLLADGSLLIDRQPLKPRSASGQEPRSVASLPRIVLPPAVKLLADKVTKGPWLRADKTAARRPTSLHFHPDWTYRSVYRGGACENTGTWYATVREIRGYAPTNPCDREEGRYGENLRGTLSQDGGLLLNGDPYHKAIDARPIRSYPSPPGVSNSH